MAKILIVDDSSVERYILSTCLKKHGHKIVGEASNGQEAVLFYKASKPDIVILDIVMPNDNGIDILKQIIEYDSNANVIMCTSAALQNTIINAVQLGAKHFLVKPVCPESLMATIHKTLEDKS